MPIQTGSNQIIVRGVNDDRGVPENDASYYGAIPGGDASVNTAAIQQALNAGGLVTIVRPGTYLINDWLIIKSNTRLVISEGVTLKPAPGTNKNVIVNEAYLGQGRFTDINVSTLTSSGVTGTATTAIAHGFVVGDYVAINWAKPEYYAGVYRVESVPSATQFTYFLASTPSNATASAGTGGQIRVRRADVNISIEAHGVIDRDATNNPTAPNAFGLYGTIVAYAFNTYVTGRFINAPKYNVFLSCVTNAYCIDLTTAGPSDGVHVNGPALGVAVENYDAQNNDNAVAFLVGDYVANLLTEGAILGCSVRNLTCRGNALPAVRLLGSLHYSVSATVDGVFGSVGNCALIDAIQDPQMLPDDDCWLKAVTIQNVFASCIGTNMLNINAVRCDYLLIENVTQISTAVNQAIVNLGTAVTDAYGMVILRGLSSQNNVAHTSSQVLMNAGNYSEVHLENCTYSTTSTGNQLVFTNGTLAQLNVRNCLMTTTSSGAMLDIRAAAEAVSVESCRYQSTSSGALANYTAAGSGESIALNNVTSNGGSSSKVVNMGGGSYAFRIAMTGCYFDTSHWIVNSAITTNKTIVTASGCTIKPASNNAFRHTAATGGILVRSGGCDYAGVTGSALVKTSTGTLEAFGWDIPQDVATLELTADQFCYNTNAAAAGGVGIARYRAGWARV